MCRTRYKRKSVRDELTRKGSTHPKRGAGRHALPIKSKSFLPAAPIGVPCGTALPHLGAQNSLGCKEDAPCSLFRCRWRSFAERAALSNAGSARYRLPCRPQTHLPAAPIGVPCRTASPHLEVQHSPACKEDAPCSLFRCRWRSFAEWAALSNAGSARYRLPCRPQTHLPAALKHIIYNGYIPAFGSAVFAGLQRGRPLLPVSLPLALIRGMGSAEQREERGKRN